MILCREVTLAVKLKVVLSSETSANIYRTISVTSQKIVLFIAPGVRTSNLQQVFRMTWLLYTFTVEVMHSFKTYANFYKTTQCDIPEYSGSILHCCGSSNATDVSCRRGYSAP
jgi:hypothetical protein